MSVRSTPTTTVVVVTWNSSRHVAPFLEHLEAGMEGAGEWRLVVVDNDSADDTVDLVRRLRPATTVVSTGRNAGYAAGINAGSALAGDDDVLLVLNPDVRLHPGAARALLARLAEPGVGIVFPRLLDDDGRPSDSERRDPSVRTAWAEAVLGGRRAARLGWGEVVPAAAGGARDVEWATGAALAVSAACRATVGGWDESFFLYSEEVDYCQRARAAGFRLVLDPAAVVEHSSGAYGTDVALWRTLVHNRVRHHARHHGPVGSALFRAGVALGEALRAPRHAAHRAGLAAALDRHDPPPVGTGTATAATTGREGARRPGFVWFAAQDWWYHNQAHSDFQLMKETSRSERVLVVNSLGLRMPHLGNSTGAARRIVRKLRSTTKLVRRPLPDLPDFHVMTPVILPFYGTGPAAAFSAWFIRAQVRVVARALGIGPDAAVGVTIPTAWPVVAPMRRSALVFNRSDLHSAFPEADQERIAALEDTLLRRSDRVLYVSHELMEQDSAVVGDRAFFLDHGVDLTHFTPAPEGSVAPEVAALPSPRVGFFGGFDDYVVDMDLLLRTARELPDVHLVLVGDATCPMDDLVAEPNVTWLGKRPYAEIPALGRGFDVALMPWLDNDWIRHANPIKLKEYLALGLPVVTTYYPEVEPYRDLVRVAPHRDDFVGLVKETLSHPGDGARRRTGVLECSWAARAAALGALVDDVRGA